MYFLNSQFQLFLTNSTYSQNCDYSSLGHLLSFCRTKKNRCTKRYTIWGAQDIGTPNFGSQNIGSRTFQPQEGICTYIYIQTALWSPFVESSTYFFPNSDLLNIIRSYNWHLLSALGLAFCDLKLRFYHNSYYDGNNSFFIWKALLFTVFVVW